MEVSSHALYLDRVYGSDFDVGVFTNLTQDHLDFHKTMENYRDAKAILFDICKKGVINTDDKNGEFIAKSAKCQVMTYGVDESADINAKNVTLEQKGVSFEINNKKYSLGIPGKFSVYNALSAIGALKALGVDDEIIREGLSEAKGVRGRAEVVPVSENFTVLVDYAHTPDGIENILKTAKGFAKGRVVILFGCGGDRDNTKRPVMGEIASSLADFCIVTSDNPRTEDPMSIINEILPGVKGEHVVIENRREAIEYAIKNAQKDDVIILAGKGHEDYQQIGKEKIHFDEVEILMELKEKYNAKN
jgi:UDP-N-acetylmuramoyl-L-alanyl-D-glutamate--2,6-diaminopimelate ligase